MKLSDRYIKWLSQNLLADTSIGIEWVEFSDFYRFIQNLVFPAAVESAFGSFIVFFNPTLAEDFWAFDRSIPILMKGVPRFLCPEVYKTRSKLLKMMKKWAIFANESSDFSKMGAEDPFCDPYFGSK